MENSWTYIILQDCSSYWRGDNGCYRTNGIHEPCQWTYKKMSTSWRRNIRQLTTTQQLLYLIHILYSTHCCINIIIISFIHLVVCLTTGPKPHPKRTLHIVQSRASALNWEYPLLSLSSSSSFLCLLPRRPATSIPPFIFPSITRCRRQFLRKMWPIQLTFCLLISCRIFLCSLTLILLHFSHGQSKWSFPSFSSTTFRNFPDVSDLLLEASKFQHHIKLCSKCSTSLASSSIPSPVC